MYVLAVRFITPYSLKTTTKNLGLPTAEVYENKLYFQNLVFIDSVITKETYTIIWFNKFLIVI